MSKKSVIVKRLASIQNFGNMDVLCTDKTGTLTENVIALVLHTDIEGKDSEKVLFYAFLNSYYETGLKSPLDEAILKYKQLDVNGFDKVDEVPFDFVEEVVLSIVVDHEKGRLIICKGALEEIASVCSRLELKDKIVGLTNEQQKKIQDNYHRFTPKASESSESRTEGFEEKPAYSAKDGEGHDFLGLHSVHGSA